MDDIGISGLFGACRTLPYFPHFARLVEVTGHVEHIHFGEFSIPQAECIWMHMYLVPLLPRLGKKEMWTFFFMMAQLWIFFHFGLDLNGSFHVNQAKDDHVKQTKVMDFIFHLIPLNERDSNNSNMQALQESVIFGKKKKNNKKITKLSQLTFFRRHVINIELLQKTDDKIFFCRGMSPQEY